MSLTESRVKRLEEVRIKFIIWNSDSQWSNIIISTIKALEVAWAIELQQLPYRDPSWLYLMQASKDPRHYSSKVWFYRMVVGAWSRHPTIIWVTTIPSGRWFRAIKALAWRRESSQVYRWKASTKKTSLQLLLHRDKFIKRNNHEDHD